jgi:hypothetical protein
LSDGGSSSETTACYLGGEKDYSDDEDEEQFDSNYITNETGGLNAMRELERRAVCQVQYKIELERQKKLMGLTYLNNDARYLKDGIGDGYADSIKWAALLVLPKSSRDYIQLVKG